VKFYGPLLRDAAVFLGLAALCVWLVERLA